MTECYSITILPLSSPESSKNKALVATLSMENKLEYFGINRQNLDNFSAYHCLNIDIKLLIQALSPLSEFVQQKKTTTTNETKMTICTHPYFTF